jgi:hypothetical protein
VLTAVTEVIKFIIFLQLFYFVGHIVLLSIELVKMYIFQIFKIPFIPSVILLFWPYSVQNWSCEHVGAYISDFQDLLYSFSYFIILGLLLCCFIIICIFLQLFYYFCHIILSSIVLVSMYIFQIFKIHFNPSVILLRILAIFIILFSIELGNMSMFQGDEVCYSSAIILLFFIY